MSGLQRSGWKLVYTDHKSELIGDMEQVHEVDLLWREWQKWDFADLRYSIGLLIEDDGTVLDSAPSMSGYNAGIMPRMQVLGVNGMKFSVGSHVLDYHGGLRYPHLQRDPTKPDLLLEIITRRAASTSAN